ncbi:MAG: non-heme iron oxygenase ferredoxin subunit [Thermomicrobiales bacterium]
MMEDKRRVDYVTVAKTADLQPGEMKAVKVGRQIVGLANVDGEFLAFDDTCTHEEASLTEGEIFDDVVECPLHGAAFNLRTGAVESFPATRPLPTFDVRVVGDEVQVATEPRPT